MPRVLPDVPPASASTAEPPAPALNTPKPIPPVDEKLRAPTPKPPGLKDTPPTPATLPLVAEAMPPTATGGTVARVKLKGVGFEPACVAPMMVLLKAVVFPSTSSCDAGVVVPMPTLPAFGSVTSAYLLLTVPPPPGELMYRPVKLNSVLPGTMVGPSMFTPRNGYGASPLRNEVAVITASNAVTPPVAAASRKYTNRAGCFDRFVAVLTSFRVILKADSTLPVIGLLLFKVIVEFSALVAEPVASCTSKLACGLVVPIPTCPLSNSEELITFAPVASNLVTKFCVPPPPIVAAPMDPPPAGLTTVPTPAPPPDEGLASTNDDSGFPPNVSASAAFNAYGTLTSNTRGCSSSFARFTCTPSQRGSPAVNSSRGNPSFLVEPSSTVYLPCS